MAKKKRKSGLPPGTLVFTGEQFLQEANITLLQYNENECIEKHLTKNKPPELTPSLTTWYDVRGLHDVELIEKVSGELREVMAKLAPEFVNAAEGFAEEVTYIPVSALGKAPEEDPDTGMLGVRPKEVQPVWAEVPLLYLLNLTSTGLIPAVRRRLSSFD